MDNRKGMRNRSPDIPGETWNFLGDTVPLRADSHQHPPNWS